MRPPLFGSLPFTALTADQKLQTPLVIFDIDNCVADDGWRIPLIDWSQTDLDKRYEAYHRAAPLDESPNVAMVQQWAQTHIPVFLTARPLANRAATDKWIRHTFGLFCFILITRNDNDNRPSVQLKDEMVQSLPEYGVQVFNVEHAYDDRLDVCEMYHKRFGFNVTQLAIHNVCAMTPPKLQTLEVSVDAKGIRQAVADAKREMEEGLLARFMSPVGATLHEMAGTFAERNAVYKDNYKTVGHVLSALYQETEHRAATEPRHFEVDHLLWLMVVKLTRFVHSNSTHADSMLDLGVYAAMIATILKEQQQ